jgi:uncharacterized small protein (TIGR04563 family)
MSATDNRKQSLYFPEDMLEEIQREAGRQDRSISWIVQQAWKVARTDIRKMPSVNDVIAPPPRPAPAVSATSETESSFIKQ